MFGLDQTTFMSITAALLGFFYYVLVSPASKSRQKLPPCPARPWPLLGNITSLEENPRQQFKQWHKQHGDLFSIYFGNTLVVVVNGYKMIRESLVSKGNAFLDRPPMVANDLIGMRDAGLAFNCGPAWKEARSTTMLILKEFGLGKDTLAQRVQEEVNYFIEKLADLRGEATDIQYIIHISVSNVIASIIVGKRFSYDDARLKKAVESVVQLASCAREAAAINYLPVLRYLPGDMFNSQRLLQATTTMRDFFAEFFSQSEVDEPGENFISSYKQKREEKLKAGETTSLSDKNLMKTLMDLLGAGTETTSSTISWCLLYILHHPEVQLKIHEELDQVVGQNRKPNLDDKPRLPYLDAVIKESQRLASVVPFSIMRLASKDVVLGKYVIPEGTSVIPNLDSVLHDPEIWGSDAEDFRPERFLNSDGTVRHREEFIPFSVGRRNCLGMSVAQTELFLFLSAMFQRFKFVLPAPGDLPSLKETFGLTAVPAAYKVRCLDRLQENVTKS
ncbi:cytochrome p450 ii f2-like protein ii [Plakobranchus ocellatus]|uniref:Cytochrome p450 ii f2-like protein ii n=1 Tax=Plakobranchus ocellatus TaxID=259542 RepID=A0AAV4A407_9GAST|nr:cytochrome p450 ii f2-like protein ii [Plakobranchus ocellatus]